MAKPKSALFPLIIFLVSTLNHLLTFLAYDWYAGIDNCSYDVAGLQLVSGYIFDIFPIMFRPPFLPIVKNILYLIFENKPYLLSILIHSFGVAMALLAYKLGNRFNKWVGLITGMLVALNLPMSVFFHHISIFTFFVPFLLLAADRFVVWVKRPNGWTLTSLVITTFFCFLIRLEAISLVLIFFIFGWCGHRRWRQAILFFLACTTLYNLICFFNYVNFGYWGITYNKGWALFTRITRAEDRQFDINSGLASMKIGEYMKKEWPSRVKETHPIEYQMYILNLAQKDLGYIGADRLFFQASMESIRRDPIKFIRFTFLRVLGQLGLFEFPGLNHQEFPYQSESGHMWGFSGKREKERLEQFQNWEEDILRIDSPLEWERIAIKRRFCKFIGLKNSEILKPPESFKIIPNVRINEYGEVETLRCGDGNMTERLYNWRDLDIYFFLKYWGQKKVSSKALKVLSVWDVFMEKGKTQINSHIIMWLLWIIGIAIPKERWHSIVLGAFLSFVLAYAFIQAVFSDNFGGRFELYMRTFLWLGASYGVWALLRFKKSVKNSNN